MPYTFRPAVESDVQAIADIYNASVMAGGATADLTPRTFDQRRAWVESHTPPYGVFVVEAEAVHEGNGAGVIGENDAAGLAHVAGQRLGEQPVKHERAYSPALPCRIDVIGQIGDTVISCAVIEHGERTEAND